VAFRELCEFTIRSAGSPIMAQNRRDLLVRCSVDGGPIGASRQNDRIVAMRSTLIVRLKPQVSIAAG
jgi:hypothetical protein